MSLLDGLCALPSMPLSSSLWSGALAARCPLIICTPLGIKGAGLGTNAASYRLSPIIIGPITGFFVQFLRLQGRVYVTFDPFTATIYECQEESSALLYGCAKSRKQLS